MVTGASAPNHEEATGGIPLDLRRLLNQTTYDRKAGRTFHPLRAHKGSMMSSPFRRRHRVCCRLATTSATAFAGDGRAALDRVPKDYGMVMSINVDRAKAALFRAINRLKVAGR
jgi:hypothetical protein